MPYSSAPDGKHAKVDARVSKSPLPVEGAPLWFIAGICILAIAVSLALISAVCFYARCRKRHLLEKDSEGQLDVISFHSSTGDTSSDTSMELPKTSSMATMRPSLSIDVGAPFSLKKHPIQPLIVPHWNYLMAPRASIGSLQPDLYRSSDSEESTITHSESGRLWFSVLYKKEDYILQVTLIKAKHLPGRGFCNGPRDPFVKLYLLPEEEKFKQSKVRKRTLSPKFNETFEFEVPEIEVQNRCLRFSVYDIDKKKVRHCLGHVLLSLAKVDLTTNAIRWKDLEKNPVLSVGARLQVSLMCNPVNNKIKVAICKAENVDSLEKDVGVYLRVELFHGNKVVKSRRTSSRNAVGPNRSELIFREAVSFGVPARFYDSCYLHLTSFASSGVPLPSDVSLGSVTIGPFLFSRGDQLLHWQEMVTNPRTFVTRWHTMERIRGTSE